MFSSIGNPDIFTIVHVCLFTMALVMYIVGWRAWTAEKAALKNMVLPGDRDLILQRNFWSYFAFKNGPVFGWASLSTFLNLIIMDNDRFPVAGVMTLPLAVMLGWVWARARHARPCLRLNASGLQLTGEGSTSPVFIEWRAIKAVRTDQYTGEAALLLADQTHNALRSSLRIRPNDFGCPPEFLLRAMTAWHAVAPSVKTELAVREQETPQYIF